MDIYSLEKLNQSLENDQISDQEAAFMFGYLETEPIEA